MRVKTKAMLVAATRSGAGKTTVTLALIAAFRRRGLTVRAAKCGPDYIGPAFHAEASGAPCLNLDSWAMGPALLDSVAHEASAAADLLIVESAMGLFDGAGTGAIGAGAGAELAVHLRIPVLLVLDVSGQAQSAAATVLGFASYDPRLRIAGIILNRVGSDRHRAPVERAVGMLDIPVLGAILATRRSICPSVISDWCRRSSITTSSFVCIVSPSLPSGAATLPAFRVLPLLSARFNTPPWPCRLLASALRSPPMPPSPLSIRMC